MSLRLAMSIVAALVLITASAWVLIPPFPSPTMLMDKSFASLKTNLGAPTGEIPTKFVVWQRSRGIAVWSLQVGYDMAAVEPMALPRSIRRSLWVDWAGFSVPYGYATRARVVHPSGSQ